MPNLVQLKVSVKDSGIGMSKLDAINVFNPYYKTQNIHSQRLNTHGHGLGLNICKKICESLGGSIEVETQLHIGSTFTFAIDVSKISVPRHASINMEYLDQATFN